MDTRLRYILHLFKAGKTIHMTQDKATSFQIFNRISSKYDLANRVLSMGMDLRWRKKLSSHLPLKDELVLLDLATGTGDQISALFDRKAPIKQAIGIDLSEEMLRVAKEKFASKPYRAKTSFLHADALELPFQKNTFDVCTFSFGIRNVKDPLAALSEMHRVTAPRGRCLILEFSLPDNLFRAPYLFYLRHLLPRLGGWITKDPSAYTYLNRTIEDFPYGDPFLNWMRKCGWISTVAIPLLFGTVTLYRGEKV